MKLIERLNVLIQATSLSQKSGSLTLDEAVKAKTAIDIISAGVLNQNYASAINTLIEIAVSSQKKGVYSLKDAHMVYLAVEGIEGEFKNEVNKINGNVEKEVNHTNPHVLEYNEDNHNGETVITIPPQQLERKH